MHFSSFSNTFKLQMLQNTEKHSILVYAFLKTSEKSHVFCFFTNSLLLPNKNSEWP